MVLINILFNASQCELMKCNVRGREDDDDDDRGAGNIRSMFALCNLRLPLVFMRCP